MSDETPSEMYNEDCPTCPYCGYKDIEWWDGGIGDSDYWGDFSEYKCDNCDKKLYLEREMIWNSKPSCELNKTECELEEMVIESDYLQCKNCGELKPTKENR